MISCTGAAEPSLKACVIVGRLLSSGASRRPGGKATRTPSWRTACGRAGAAAAVLQNPLVSAVDTDSTRETQLQRQQLFTRSKDRMPPPNYARKVAHERPKLALI